MKLIALFVVLVLSIGSYSQKLDQSISEIANSLAQKASKLNKVKLALTDFVNSDGKVDALTIYIRDEIELKLINSDYGIQIIDRKHIKLLLSEHHLQSEGLIDESIAKSAISFIKVDGWVIAEITYLDEQIKIKVTITDVSSSLMYAASSTNFFSDTTITSLLDSENKVCSTCGGKGTVQFLSTCSTCNGKGSYNCSNCDGKGYRQHLGSNYRCESCNGSGKIFCTLCSGNGSIISYQTCSTCNGIVSPANLRKPPFKANLCDRCIGSGKIKEQIACEKCNGTGRNSINLTTCSFCSGTGITGVSTKACPKCGGKGKL